MITYYIYVISCQIVCLTRKLLARGKVVSWNRCGTHPFKLRKPGMRRKTLSTPSTACAPISLTDVAI